MPDLVQSKKTARNRDWPVIELLVNIHIHENLDAPRPEWIRFWLSECRSPGRLVALARRFTAECRGVASPRPLLAHALAGDEAKLTRHSMRRGERSRPRTAPIGSRCAVSSKPCDWTRRERNGPLRRRQVKRFDAAITCQ